MTKPVPAPPSVTRFHALDSLRASMMLLGIWFHASYSYITLQTARPYKDPNASPIFNAPLLLIHVFRMPIFFLLAGFFGRYIWERSGSKEFLRNRVRRILIPFLVAWPFIFVFNTLGQAYGLALTTNAPLRGMNADYWTSGQFVTILRTQHLWFLYYLMYYYLLTVGIAALLLRYVSTGKQEGIESMFRKLLSSQWRVPILALPTAILLFFMRGATIQTDFSFIVLPKVFFIYGIFFGFGWLLYRQRDLLPDFPRHAWTHTLLALLITPLYLLSGLRVLRAAGAQATRFHLFAAASGAITVWLLVFGIMGLFIRYCDRPSARARYLADASYWMYIVHMPLVIWLPMAFRTLSWPGVVKFTMVMAIAVPILLASYEWGVRYTFIGRALNGPRERPRAPDTMVDVPYKAAV